MRIKWLQLTPSSSLQSFRGTVLAAGVVPQRWRSALLGAAEPPIRWAAQRAIAHGADPASIMSRDRVTQRRVTGFRSLRWSIIETDRTRRGQSNHPLGGDAGHLWR